MFADWLTRDEKLNAVRHSPSWFDHILESKMKEPVIATHLQIEEEERASVKIAQSVIEELIEEADRREIPGVIWVYFWRTYRAAAISVHLAGAAPKDAIKKAFDVPIGWFHSWERVCLDDWVPEL